MTPGQWERVRALFQSAIEQPPAARAVFVSTADGDEVIQREVQSLLEAYAAAGGFLDAPAVSGDTGVDAPLPALQPGDRIGSFEVAGVLGRGGMGEVYRACDATLGRDVAIKVLPRAFARDPQRLVRFERESRILASFNHPNIAAIHSVEQIDGLRVLVLELVEGPTLADRLGHGPLPPAEALDVARELARALEAAHDRGIVHRDLKPANIKLTPASGIKLLDFGLAKEPVDHAAARTEGPPDSTTDGLVFGTCAYMSPEQARGKPVDKRTDIWAFGCVLFEMLTGTRAFQGETPSDTIAAVLEREPDWSCLPPATAPGIHRLVRRCLQKDATRRLHDIADARLEIEEAMSTPVETGALPRPRVPVATILMTLALSMAAAASGWWLHSITSGAAGIRTTRFTWALPAGMGLDSAPVISPDGRHIAFTARPATQGATSLFVRSLGELEARPIPGTEGAKQPFWSPDGRSLGYFARGKLMKVAIDGGAPVEICAAFDGRGGAWSRTGIIVFSPRNIEAGLMRVSEDGGAVEPATLLDVSQGENAHRWPAFLPDGIHFVYFVRSVIEERRGVYVGRIDRSASMPGTPLFRSEAEAVYAPLDGDDRGVLLTAAGGRIEARQFDVRRLRVIGDPKAIDLPAVGNTLYHPMMLSASPDVLAHGGTPVPFGARLTTATRDGQSVSSASERAAGNWPRLSSDGRRLAYARIDPTPGRTDIWVEDLVRGTRVRIMGNPINALPVWSPDGDRLAYLAGSILKGVLTVAAADGTGDVSTLPCPGRRCEPSDWSRDGHWVLATVDRERDRDVWMLPADGGAAARPLLAQPFPEHDARFSPDGRFVAYVSGETGRPEVSVQTVDGPRRREVISVAGGTQPVWSRDGRELFFVDPEGLLRSAPVSIAADARPHFGQPVRLDVPPIGAGHWGTQYDVSPDGRRFYLLERRLEPPPSDFGVVLGWRALLN
jgi:Tol biopolymer transport system component